MGLSLPSFSLSVDYDDSDHAFSLREEKTNSFQKKERKKRK